MKLQNKILIFLLPFVILPLITVGIIAYVRLRNISHQAIIDQNDSILNRLESDLKTNLKTALANIELFANNKLLRNYIIVSEEGRYELMQPSLLRLFASYQKAYPDYYEIRVVLPDGYEDTRSTLKMIPNVTEEEGTTAVIKQMSSSENDVFTTIFRNPDNSKLSLFVSKQIRVLDNYVDPVTSKPKLRGYLVLTISLQSLRESVEKSRIGNEGGLFVTDDQGIILFHPVKKRVGKTIPRELIREASRTKNGSVIFKAEAEGKKRVFQGTALLFNLYVFAYYPQAMLTDASYRLAILVGSIILVTVVTIYGLTFLGLRQLVISPIRKLDRAFSELGSGNLDVQVTSSTGDEFGSLVNEFKKMTERLRTLTVSRDYVDSILTSLNDALLVLSPTGEIESANKEVLTLLDYREGELIGSSIEVLFSSSETAFVEEILKRKITENIEKQLLTKTKKEIPVLFSSSVIFDAKNTIIRIICVAKDIRELKEGEASRMELEKKLHQSQKMETIGTLAGGVAHDLNNILSGIVSYPELILMDLPDDSPLRKSILTIQKSGEKAAVIVQDLLTLARRGVSITEAVNINHIISEQLKSPEFEKLISFHSNVKIEIDLEKGLLNIKGSSTHLSKCIMNLVSNAAEAMIEGGTILISTENRYIDRPIKGYEQIVEGDYVVVSVSDTGIGISVEDMAKIFEPFYTKKVMGRSGTGLGMAVVWGTVKDHNGYIDLKSTVGRGTTTTLYFPAIREQVVSDKSQLSMEDYMGRGETILVVDDVEEQQEIATGMLKKLGYSVNSVSSGEEAVEYMKNNSVDLLVLDMIMDPGIDGLATYKRVLEIHPEQKAIIASGFSETPRVKELMKLGAGAYVKKPYLMEKMGIVVKNELDK